MILVPRSVRVYFAVQPTNLRFLREDYPSLPVISIGTRADDGAASDLEALPDFAWYAGPCARTIARK